MPQRFNSGKALKPTPKGNHQDGDHRGHREGEQGNHDDGNNSFHSGEQVHFDATDDQVQGRERQRAFPSATGSTFPYLILAWSTAFVARIICRNRNR